MGGVAGAPPPRPPPATVAVCELLIEKSFEEGFRDAARAIELAERGLLLAELLDAERYGRSVVQDLQARAWAYLGNARRIAFDLAGAEAALARAERLVEEGSADPLEEARILDLRASLLSDQGHFEQAAELLDVVIDIYGDLGEPHRKGRAMISKGVFLGYSGWPEEAIRQIRKGLGLIDWDREPRLVLMARHNLAWFLNDCGRAEEALRQLERFRHTYRGFSDAWTALRLAWLDGRIAGGLGRLDEAETVLREVRRRFLADGHGYDAALVTLDLAHLHLETGRTAEVRMLAAELLDLFLSHDIHRQALAALAVFQQAADMDDATPGLVQRSPPTWCGRARTPSCGSRRRRRRKAAASGRRRGLTPGLTPGPSPRERGGEGDAVAAGERSVTVRAHPRPLSSTGLRRVRPSKGRVPLRHGASLSSPRAAETSPLPTVPAATARRLLLGAQGLLDDPRRKATAGRPLRR